MRGNVHLDTFTELRTPFSINNVHIRKRKSEILKTKKKLVDIS